MWFGSGGSIGTRMEAPNVGADRGEACCGGGCQIFLCVFAFEMVHFDHAFWSTFYTNCNCHYDVHNVSKNKCLMLKRGADCSK